MPKVTGPVFSLAAAKSLRKTLTYQKRPSGSAVYPYKKPGGREPFTPSWKQRNQRGIIGLLTAQWQNFSQATKDQWDQDAKTAGEVGSGYHYWLKKAQTNLYYYHGLCGYWSFNGPYGGKAIDLSGQGNHGTLLPFWPTNAPVWVDGQNEKFGNALSFDGIDDYVLITNAGALSLKEKVTIAMWIKPSSLGVGWSYAQAARSYETAIQQTSNVVAPHFYNEAGTKQTVAGVFSTDDVWHHVVGQYDYDPSTGNAIMNVYVDGVLKQTLPATGKLGDIGTFKLGGGVRYPEYYKGSIDEVRIYNRVLSPGEVLKNYQLFRG